MRNFSALCRKHPRSATSGKGSGTGAPRPAFHAVPSGRHKTQNNGRGIFSPAVIASTKVNSQLLDFNFGARGFELSLDLGGIVFADAFLDRFRSGFDQILGFLEPETGDRAHFLDDRDLVVAERREDEFRSHHASGPVGAPLNKKTQIFRKTA